MASSNQVLSIIFMLSLLHSYNATPSKLVQDFCATVKDPSTCLSALSLDPKSAKVSKYHDLAQIALNLAVSNTSKSEFFFDASRAKYIPTAISECVKGFAYSAGSFSSALSEIDEDPETAGYDAAVACDGATQCVPAFDSAKIQVPPEISIRVGYVYLYSNLANRLTDHLYM